MYLGVPDESVNLTFSDLLSVQQNCVAERKKIEPIQENMCIEMKEGLAIRKSPSIDFARGLRVTNNEHGGNHRESSSTPKRNKGIRSPIENSFAYDDVSGMSMASRAPYEEKRRRPGIPHSNICTLCSVYIYFFKNRCLVCGRVYCRKCVSAGMGEMPEGRKCIECLGRRFSQRYIQKAGKVGCCCSRYSSMVKQQELMWAEKGPRRTGERRYGRSEAYGPSRVVSRSRSPVTPVRAHYSGTASPTSFVASTVMASHPYPF
ncbi:hypothetical protein QJS04_geneDACA017011 [Acorus gramineus]|uniref:FYVE-type domain-containing protein n=1 Tax=Acorus gramineus TaxID=55184 RepID=A0AAV9AKR8_ACOGR|nr:hypothetical protein QJS04_geneDACA017011 [Acorus gramineus]